MAPTDRELGELSQRVKTLEATVDEIRRDVKDGNRATDEILLKLGQVSGGWKALLAVGAFAAAIGGLIAKFAPLLLGKVI